MMLRTSIIARRESFRCSALKARKVSTGPMCLPPHEASSVLAIGIFDRCGMNVDKTIRNPESHWISATVARVMSIREQTPVVFDVMNEQRSAGSVTTTIREISEFVEGLFGGIFMVKRTFQPSLLRRKRKHGFLARQGTRHGRKIMQHRRAKGRSSLCA